MLRTPEKDQTLNSNVQEDEVSSEEEGTTEIVYPSGKLAALTRKRNKILKHLKTKNPGNVDKVKKYSEEYNNSIQEFIIACVFELNRAEVSDDVRIEFNNWYTTHKETNLNFQQKVIQ